MENRFKAFAGYVVELGRDLQKIKDIEMKKFGLRANHAMCLFYLGQNADGLTAAQLTKLCKEDKAAISRCLNQLAEKGLITSEIPTDKRSYRTINYLTNSGKELTAKMNDRIESAITNGGKGLTTEQRTAFYQSLEIISNNLSEYLSKQEK